MSHSEETHICPNCGFHTSHNYCAQCGQETHLHKETFWGLVMHFIGHYFHYDSKFWQTLKALWFSPGKVTLAYWNKQRMRYIPPVSLYIFISAVFFLIMLLNPRKMLVAEGSNVLIGSKSTMTKADSAEYYAPQEKRKKEKTPWYQYDKQRDTANLVHFIITKHNLLDEKTHGHSGEYLVEHIYHTIPKVFFFLIPLMALVLRILFIRREDVFFSWHAIFSLHIHSFIFSLFILLYIPFIKDIPYLNDVLFLIAFVYSVIALHNAYQINWGRALLNSIAITGIYTMFLIIAVAIDFIAILYFV